MNTTKKEILIGSASVLVGLIVWSLLGHIAPATNLSGVGPSGAPPSFQTFASSTLVVVPICTSYVPSGVTPGNANVGTSSRRVLFELVATATPLFYLSFDDSIPSFLSYPIAAGSSGSASTTFRFDLTRDYTGAIRACASATTSAYLVQANY